MKIRSLRSNIFLSFFAVIIAIGITIAFLGFYIIKTQVIDRAQAQAKEHLHVARSVYNGKIDRMRFAFNMIAFPSENDVDGGELNALKRSLELDYLYVVDLHEKDHLKSEIARAAFEGTCVGGTRIMGKNELLDIEGDIYSRVRMPIEFTKKARPTEKRVLEDAMVMEYARPLADEKGEVVKVIYGGKVINGNFEITDRIRDFVFEDRSYEGKPVGTVTIFQDDVRIATNVLNEKGERAVGTRVSENVYGEVVEKDRSWVDRAFVVTDWYLTAYEPIKDVNDKTIGILYVGIMEKPFYMFGRNMFLIFLVVMIAVTVLGASLSYILAGTISERVTGVLKAAGKISDGDLEHRVERGSSIKELNELVSAFNIMAVKLQQRDRSLNVSSNKLEALNKSYLDLIGFVAHELKGILASTTLNAYAVRDGFLGMINFKQRKALDSVTRNLDYLAATVKNFLSLSRIEKGEFEPNKTELFIKEDILDASVEALMSRAEEKHVRVKNNVAENIGIMGDADLLRIVANNLIGNAIKYGNDNGEIILSSRDIGGFVEIEVYNDGMPISAEDKARLFKKFSRLNVSGTKKERGTGIGLFITKDIVEKHGGSISVEPREKGNSFVFTVMSS